MDQRNGVKRLANNPLAKFINPFDEMTQSMVKDEPPQEQSSAIIAAPDGTIVFGDYAVTPVGIKLPDDITEEEWQRVREDILKTLDSSVSWAIGDWAEHAHRIWGWSYAVIAEKSGYPERTLLTYTSVCRFYPMLIRNQHASFAHHRILMSHPKWKELLESAGAKKWSISQLRDEMTKDKKKRKRPTLSKADTWGGKDFAKNAKKLGLLANAVGQGVANLTPKRKNEMLGYITQIEKWLDDLRRASFADEQSE